MNKTYIDVECCCMEDGSVIPQKVIWNDGRKWKITRVVYSCASYNGEFEGIRYTVIIRGAEKYIYRIGSQWYVESG